MAQRGGTLRMLGVTSGVGYERLGRWLAGDAGAAAQRVAAMVSNWVGAQMPRVAFIKDEVLDMGEFAVESE